MTSRRRNLFVILLMLGLLAASLVVIATKPTRLGLDLKGGVELVYQGEPTPQSEVTPEAIDRSIDIIRERVDALGVAEPEIQRLGSDQISVGLPGRQERQARDRSRSARPPSSTSTTWSGTSSATRSTPIPSLYEAVKRGVASSKPESSTTTTRTGDQYYLFKTRPRRSPRARTPRARTCCPSSTAASRSGYEILTVPAGHGRRAGRAARGLPRRPGRSTSTTCCATTRS